MHHIILNSRINNHKCMYSGDFGIQANETALHLIFAENNGRCIYSSHRKPNGFNFFLWNCKKFVVSKSQIINMKNKR